MEENQKKSNNEAQKLSYEQLKAYADQLREQAKKIFQENQILRQAVNSKDIDYAFKCLEHADLFSKKFIKDIVSRLEELMSPDKVTEEKTTNKEEKE